MQLNIYSDYHALSLRAAGEIIDLVTNKPNAVICLASGDTPRLMCKLLTERALKEKLDFSRCTFIGLDEWIGIPPESEGSCHFFFQTLLFDPLRISPAQIHLLDGMSKDPAQECAVMDKTIFDKGGIDLMIVGVGMNGHIGFNEPGVSFENYSHVTDLNDTTISVGQKYFSKPVALKQGITLGLKHLLESKKTIVLANGQKKAVIIKKVVEENISTQIPATVIRMHPQGVLMIDEEAASLLKKETT
ncbi:MAG TPA: glucosamine-6-phosphate deaminase [Puia sp.]|nr:glucosamine-6-phosphate deaminase [Puia sp.]